MENQFSFNSSRKTTISIIVLGGAATATTDLYLILSAAPWVRRGAVPQMKGAQEDVPEANFFDIFLMQLLSILV
jgi:hypothetical protein